MSRDKDQYGPDPDAFKPERFLESKIRDPTQYVFGFGRRYVSEAHSVIRDSLPAESVLEDTWPKTVSL